MEHISISIQLPYENCIHAHTAYMPFNGEDEPLAEDVLKQFVFLMENIYGEDATRNAISKV